MIDVSTHEAKELIDRNEHLLFVVLFYSSLDEESKIMRNVCDKLQSAHPEYKFISVLANQGNELTDKYKISKVPSCVLIKNKSVIDVLQGLVPAELTTKIREFDPMGQIQSDQIDYAKLIRTEPLMLFIKGTPTHPQCGFTRKLIGLMDGLGVKYGYFDILTDNNVREGLKKFSDWPTYPQIYFNGVLVGGLDIVQEMIETGEFQELLNQK